MKTISGRVTSSNPISLSKATSVLTTFVAAETGASQAVAAYLRRTVEAFNELTQLHRELKGSKSSRTHKRDNEGHKKNDREERSSLEFEERSQEGEEEEGGMKHWEEQEGKKKRRKSD